MKLIEKCISNIIKLQQEKRFNEVDLFQKIIDFLEKNEKNNKQLFLDLEFFLNREDIPSDVKMKIGTWIYYSGVMENIDDV